jgi:hypothetical protein
MTTPKFQIGQVVTFIPGTDDTFLPAGEFAILRVMPAEAGARSYRVRGEQDGRERVLPEKRMRVFDGARGRAPAAKPPAQKNDVLLGLL